MKMVEVVSYKCKDDVVMRMAEVEIMEMCRCMVEVAVVIYRCMEVEVKVTVVEGMGIHIEEEVTGMVAAVA